MTFPMKKQKAALDYITKNKSIIVNLGSELGFSIKEVLETARKITGKPINAKTAGRRPGDPSELYSSAALAKELLGWQAEHSDIETLISTSWGAYK